MENESVSAVAIAEPILNQVLEEEVKQENNVVQAQIEAEDNLTPPEEQKKLISNKELFRRYVVGDCW